MAIVYVDSNATGSNNGTNWGNAYTTLQAGLTAWTTSDILWVAHNHSETFASSNTLTSVNSGRLHPCVLYRVNSGTDLYDPSPLDGTDTAQIIGTTTSQPLTFNFSGSWFGFSFEWGDYVKVNPSLECYFEDCDISYGIQTSTFAYLDLSDVTGATFKNCLIKNIWGADSYIITQSAGNVLFIGCEFNVNDNPATGFIQPLSAAFGSRFKAIDCDFTALSENILVDTSDFSASSLTENSVYEFINCKMKSGYLLWDNTMDVTGGRILARGCSSSDKSYINESVTDTGEVLTSATAYHDNGFLSSDDLSRLSQVITPGSRCDFARPLSSAKISGIVDATGSKTFTVELVENFTTALTKQECWLDLYYYDSASNTNHKVDTSTREFAKLTYTALAAGTGLDNWTGEPASSRSVKIEVTVTVNKTGYYYGIVHVGKYEAGKVVHVDPMLEVA